MTTTTTDLWSRCGAAIERHLTAHALTHRELADSLGVSHQAVGGWVAGKPIGPRHAIPVATIARFPTDLRRDLVAHLLDVPLEDLVAVLELEQLAGAAS